MAKRAIPNQGGGTPRWRWVVAATITSLLLSLVPVMARVALAAGPFTVDTTTDLVSATPTACATTVAGECSLRQAIREANVGGGATTINLPPGTYTLTLSGTDDANATGDLDIAATANITLLGTGTDPKIVDGNATDRVFDVQSGGSLTIGSVGVATSGVTIRNGNVNARGGGIRIRGAGTLAVNSSIVTGNHTTGTNQGGGISAEGGSAVTLTSTTVSNNLAGGDGGGIARSDSGPLTLTGSRVTGNNSPAYGGGIQFNSSGVLSVNGSTISHNSSGLAGGGLELASAANGANAVTGSTISDNSTAGSALAPGGGIFVSGNSLVPLAAASLLSLTNTTISGNSAGTQTGGGISSGGTTGGTTTLTNVTVASNNTGIARNSGTLTVHNTIVANSTGGANCSGTIVNGGNNVDSGATCGFGAANNSLSSTDPLLGPLTVSALGVTATHALAALSPAVERVPAIDPNCNGTDQRGVIRPQGTNCDSGAYELLPTPTIGSVAPNSGTTSGGTGIAITGTGFQSGATVTVDGNPCSAVVVSGGTTVNAGMYGGTSITCVTPPGTAGAKDVVVTNPDAGTNTSAGSFTYVAPTVTSISPTSGPSSGGTAVTIIGTLFDPSATVTIGGAPCLSIVVNDPTSISCTTPAGTPGLVDVVVTNPAAPGVSGQATLAGGFDYLTTQGAQPSPASLTFAAQQVNTSSATQPVTLTNTGTTPLVVTDVAITGANVSDFAVETTDCLTTLAANASCTVAVSFTPTGTGARGAALTFTNDSGGVVGSTQNVSLSGTGIAPTVTFAPTSVVFGNQQVGTTSPAQTVTLTNNGLAPLAITSVVLTGTDIGDFILNNIDCTGSIAVGASCTLKVQFKPTANDLRVASITVTDNANAVPGSVQSVPLSGGALPPFTVNASANTGGTIAPAGVTNYTAGATANYTATPDAGQVFLGWTLDGVYVGYASPLAFTVTGNRVLVGKFAARASFGDVPTSDPDYQAITFLAALGIVNPNGVNGTGNFEPNRDVKRAEMAAFIARVFGWDTQFHSNTFPDQCDPAGVNCVDNELWNNIAALQDYGVVGGYTDQATCAASGTTSPCYLPRDPVKRVQVVSIVARAFTKDATLRPNAFWDRLAADLAQYTNVPNEGTQRSDLTTYRANAGPIPGQTADTTFPTPEGNGSRRFVIQALYLAFNAWFGTDRVP